MIVKEFFETREDGVNLYHIYSDTNHYIIQSGTNAVYSDVIDVENAGFEYTESDIVIGEEPEQSEEPEPTPSIEPTTLDGWKERKLKEIDEYDVSSMVNGFYLNGQLMWLDRETRASLKNTIESLALVGRDTLAIWYGETQINLDLNTARQLLAVLEVYATDCYNVTIQHKISVAQLTNIDDVMDFDITEGYPEMPRFGEE